MGLEDTTPQLPTGSRPPASPRLPSGPHPPGSPRPATYQPTVPVDDDIYEDGFDGGFDDGEIYEGLDDVEIPPRVSQPPPIPSLPPQRGSNNPMVQPPSLPPRNMPVLQPPILPPRINKSESLVQDYEAPKPSPPTNRKTSLPQEFDEELYDDVMTMGQDDVEETYDDIESVAIKKPLPTEDSPEELYEDMVPEEADTLELQEDEEYSDMTLTAGNELNDDNEDFYDDVNVPPPQPAPPRPPKATATTKTTTISSASVRPPPMVTSPTTVKQTTPATVKQTTPTTVKQTTPATVKQTMPTTIKQRSVEDSKVTPSSLKKSSTLPGRPTSGGAKRMNTKGKVAQMSKMFGQSEDGSEEKQKGSGYKKSAYSGTLMYKSPGKASYSSNHCVLDNNILIFYTQPNDKLSHYRLSLRDAGLKLSTPDGHGAKYTFQILKGTNVHNFSLTSKEDFIGWMAVLVTASQRACPDKDDLYHAIRDHHGNGNGEISFKKDDIIWVIQRDSPTVWNGIVGSSETTFTSTAGSFPKEAIEPLTSEDVYI